MPTVIKKNPKTTSEAVSLIAKLCEFHTILTAHIYLKIFSLVGRTSNYLESKNLDLLAAWEMVDKTSKSISAIEFEDIYKMSEEFSIKMNESLDNFKLSENIVIETELPKARVRSKKRVYGEWYVYERPTNVKFLGA